MSEPRPDSPANDAPHRDAPENPAAGEQEAIFDAVLHPHRSLSPQGFLVLMILLAIVSFIAGMAFLMAGAWPVFGFFGLDVALIYIAFRKNYESGRLYESLRLTRDALTVERVLPSGEVRRWSFQPYWLRVEMDEPLQHASQLRLTSHGRTLVVGSFLTPEERAEVARALRQALACQRSLVEPVPPSGGH